jgi:hypothetical protein
MPDDTILCWKTSLSTPTGHVTVADYKAWRKGGETGKDKIAEFFRERMRERYIEPVKALDSDERNGFSIMAQSCLLIETYETFRQGWKSSSDKSKQAFCYFFDREDSFRDFRGHAQQFYKNVRCGILHQGETTGGWRITRKDGERLFDTGTHTVHATKFHALLADVIDKYRTDLKASALTTDIWKHFATKMQATLDNCEP